MHKRWLLGLPAMLLLALAFNTAWNLLQSEVWRSQTQDFLDYWAQTQTDGSLAVDKNNWQLTLAGADNALAHMPNSPDLQVMRAKVLDRGVRYGWSDTKTEEPMELDAWQQAITLRPAWPYSWSDYAMARSQRSLIDQPFAQALIRANQLGPWEQRVMTTSTILGRYYQGWLSDSLQRTLDNSLERLRRLYPYQAKRLEKQYPLP